MSTFVIAEAGSCHDGSLWKALRLISAAKAAGADACKFQYWSSAARLAERRNASDYFSVYFKYRVPTEWLKALERKCHIRDIEFMCTVYLPEDIATIAPLVKRFKVASFESQDVEFVRAHYVYEKEIIVSTGMSEGLGTLCSKDYAELTSKVRYLHCISAYPTPLEQANLGAIWNTSGYSDHTHNVLTGALAVAAGAKILEVHFRLDDTDSANPDYATALSPGQLKDYVSLVRQAEVMMGTGVKAPQPAEEAMMRYRVKA